MNAAAKPMVFICALLAHLFSWSVVSKAADAPVVVLSPNQGGLASRGHCVGKVDTPECAAQTIVGCTHLFRRSDCDKVGLFGVIKVSEPPDPPDGVLYAYVIATTASFRLNNDAARESTGNPRAVAGWAIVDVVIRHCGGEDDPTLGCYRPGLQYVTFLFRPVPFLGGWSFVGWTDGDSYTYCQDESTGFCNWYRYDEDWSDAWWAQRERFRDIQVKAPGPIDLSQLVRLPPVR